MDRDTLIRAAPLMKGEIPDQRQQAKEKVIRSILSLDECPGSIRQRTIQKYGSDLGITFDEATISQALNNLSNNGYLKETGDGEFKIIEKPETNELDELINESWEEFRGLLEDASRDIDVHFVNNRMEDAFKSSLNELFKSITKYSERIDDHEIETIETVNLDRLANEISQEKSLREPDTFCETFKEYIKTDHGEAFEQFSEAVYSGAINYNLIARESHIEFDEIPADNKELFFDVNVLVVLLCKSDHNHDAIISMVERAQELGYDLYFLPDSKNELSEFIRMSKKEASGFKESGGNVDVIESQFVKDWLNRDLSWDNYRSEVLDSWVENVELLGLKEYDGESSPDEDEIDKVEEMFIRVEKIKEQHGGKIKRSDKLTHDARLLAQVTDMRSNSDADITAGPYVITRDSSVIAVGNLGDEGPEHGSALHPRRFLDYILAFTSADINTKERREIVTALIKSSVNEYEEPNIDEFSELIQARTGLDHAHKEVIKRILVNSPQKSDIRDALRENDGVKADNLAMDALNNGELLEQLAEEWDKRDIIQNIRESMDDVKEEKEELERDLRNEREQKRFMKELLYAGQSGPHIEIEASSDAKADAQAIQQFNVEINKFIEVLDGNLDSGIADSEIPNPPDDASDLEEVRDWLTSAATVLGSMNGLQGMEMWATELLDKLPTIL